MAFWLTEKYEPLEYKFDFSKEELFLSFTGNKERRQAVLYFLEEVIKEDTPQSLMLISQEEMSWLLEDLDFLNKWKNKLREILNMGHKINIIHWVDRSTHSLEDIIGQWLPLYLTGNIKSWYLPKYSESLIKSTLFLFRNKIVLVGMEGVNPESRYTTLIKDPLSLSHYQWIFDNVLSKCYPLVNVFSIIEGTKFLKTLHTLKDIEGDLISISNNPGFHTLPEDMFYELLNNNGILGGSRKRCISYYYALNDLIKKRPLKSIYTKDKINKASERKNDVFKDLSRIADKSIYASKDFLKRHYSYLLGKAQEDNSYKIGFIDDTTELNIFINSEGYTFTWNPEKSSSIVMVSEPNVVAAFYSNLLKIWEDIPRKNKIF